MILHEIKLKHSIGECDEQENISDLSQPQKPHIINCLL